MKKLIAGLASLVGVAACVQDTPYGFNVMYSDRDSVQPFFTSAVSRGPLFVDIHGSYSGYESEEVAPIITAAMEKGVTSRKIKTTTNMAEAHSPAYRVIWLIAPPKNYNANRVCSGSIPASDASDKPTFAAIFCSDDKVLRDISGWVKHDVLAQSSEFTKFIGVVTRELVK